MAQKRVSHSNQENEEPTPIPDPPAAGQSATTSASADLDSLLDDIDEVLETNAEEFVQGFVQKGGQ